MAKPDSVYQKLYRAKHHFDELRNELKDYYESEPGEVIRTISTNGQHTLTYGSVKPTPARLGLICGDCLQCLRSSLDYLVWELAVANGAQPNHNQMFPICLSEQDFTQQIARHRLEGIQQEAIDLIKDCQPFLLNHPNDSPLAILDKLANINKHRRVIFTNLVGAFTKPDIDIMQVKLKIQEVSPDGLVVGEFDVWASLRFGEERVRDFEVSKTLDLLAKTIGDAVLPQFERFF